MILIKLVCFLTCHSRTDFGAETPGESAMKPGGSVELKWGIIIIFSCSVEFERGMCKIIGSLKKNTRSSRPCFDNYHLQRGVGDCTPHLRNQSLVASQGILFVACLHKAFSFESSGGRGRLGTGPSWWQSRKSNKTQYKHRDMDVAEYKPNHSV